MHIYISAVLSFAVLKLIINTYLNNLSILAQMATLSVAVLTVMHHVLNYHTSKPTVACMCNHYTTTSIVLFTLSPSTFHHFTIAQFQLPCTPVDICPFHHLKGRLEQRECIIYIWIYKVYIALGAFNIHQDSCTIISISRFSINPILRVLAPTAYSILV